MTATAPSHRRWTTPPLAVVAVILAVLAVALTVGMPALAANGTISNTVTAAGRSIILTSGSGVGVDMPLPTASRINGKVTAEGTTTGMPGVSVTAWVLQMGPWPYYEPSGLTTQTAADGTYDLGGLAGGYYRLMFAPPPTHLTEWYDDASDLPGAKDIFVSAATTVTGIDASLAPAAHVAGKVTDEASTTGLPNVRVRFYRHATTGGSDRWTQSTSVWTAANGTYLSGALDAAACKVVFEDDSGNYLAEVYDDRAGLDYPFGDDVTLTRGITTTVDARLALAGKIAGRVTDASTGETIAAATVWAWRCDPDTGWAMTNTSASSDDSGTYVLGGLRSGVYRVSARKSATYPLFFRGDARTASESTDVTVTASTTTTGVDIGLRKAATLAGVVTDEGAGAALADVTVRAYARDATARDWTSAGSTVTGAGGAYALRIAEGAYRIAFLPANRAYADEYDQDALSIDVARDVSLASGTTATANAVLSPLPADTVEPDGDPSTSRPIVADGSRSRHIFGVPFDIDFRHFETTATGTYVIQTFGANSTVLSLHGPDGRTALATDWGSGDLSASRILWTSRASRRYHFSIQSQGIGRCTVSVTRLTTATAFTLQGSASTVGFRGRLRLFGTLLQQGTPTRVPDRTDVWLAKSTGTTWTAEETATYNPYTLTYEATETLDLNTRFRMRLAGDETLLPGESNMILVKARAWLSKPSVPSRVRRDRIVTVTGSLLPIHSGATKVYFLHKVGSRWIRRVVATAKLRATSTGVRYTAKARLRQKGRWYARAYHSDATHAPTYGAIKYFLVR